MKYRKCGIYLKRRGPEWKQACQYVLMKENYIYEEVLHFIITLKALWPMEKPMTVKSMKHKLDWRVTIRKWNSSDKYQYQAMSRHRNRYLISEGYKVAAWYEYSNHMSVAKRERGGWLLRREREETPSRRGIKYLTVRLNLLMTRVWK